MEQKKYQKAEQSYELRTTCYELKRTTDYELKNLETLTYLYLSGAE
jgi:hypothetical protein